MKIFTVIKWVFIYLFAFAIGLLEYLPIPNLPESIITVVQELSFYLPFISIGLIIHLLFKRKWCKPALFLIPLLFFVQISPFIIRDYANQYIVSQNQDKPIHLIENVVAGTRMKKYDDNVVFSWCLSLDGMEELIYQPNHENVLPENWQALEIIDSNWYVLYSVW